jgi:anti-sigma B factor antagonist
MAPARNRSNSNGVSTDDLARPLDRMTKRKMRLQEQVEGTALVVKLLDSRFDASIASVVKERFAELIHEGHTRIALDISEVEFIDSLGLSAAVWAFKRLGENGELVIIGAQGAVMSIFRLTRLDKVFRIFPDTKMAVAALSG